MLASVDLLAIASEAKWFMSGANSPFQEQNEMSGSRGEANFVWKCKNCKVGLRRYP
jgi:hypothetical protein